MTISQENYNKKFKPTTIKEVHSGFSLWRHYSDGIGKEAEIQEKFEIIQTEASKRWEALEKTFDSFSRSGIMDIETSQNISSVQEMVTQPEKPALTWEQVTGANRPKKVKAPVNPDLEDWEIAVEGY